MPVDEPTARSIPFETLLEATPDAMLVADADGRILLVNAQAERLFGYTRAELVGSHIEMLVPERYKGSHARHRATYFGRPQVRPMGAGLELNGRRKDGSEFPVEISLSPAQTQTGVVAISTVRDITDRRKADQEREQLIREQAARKEAEAANRMKDEFLRVLSHELRTPLHAIVGWAHMLEGGSLDEAERAKAVAAILRNARAQTHLVSDILDLSRITTGKVQLSTRPLSLPKVVLAALDSVRPAAEAKQIGIQTVLGDGALMVAGDTDRLQQVVWNLLSNAIKFTPHGGRVTVRLEAAGSHARLAVEDTGIGIEPGFLPQVFVAFRQADSSTSRSYAGLGLGLAIVRELVELHGGTVAAASGGRDQGATFVVDLPLRLPAADASADGPSAPSTGSSLRALPSLRGVRLLVVEDEPDGREMIQALLQELGAEVWSVGGAEEALEALRVHRPDAIVSDIEMGGEDGYSLIQRVRRLAPEAGGLTPAVALTAHARVEDRLMALTFGFEQHVAKPVDVRELSTVIAALVGRSRDAVI